MCGLLAFFSARGAAPAHRDAVASALECLHHRGPDDSGVEVVDADTVLGHQRLSIIDVPLSHQPLSYLSRRYLLIFSGAIYNYVELREQLSREFGAAFATAGDAEVLVAGYHYWGEPVLARLRGMFAFVIWDRERRRAFGARDRYGVKPLYYLQTVDGLYLASEKKALLPFAVAAEAADAGVDRAGLAHYLTLQYVPEPGTLHRDIARIGSGECLTWTSPGAGDAGGGGRRRGVNGSGWGGAAHPGASPHDGAGPYDGAGSHDGADRHAADRHDADRQDGADPHGGPGGHADDHTEGGAAGPAGLTVRRWYRPAFRPAPVDDPERLYADIRETLRESVRVHMRSDVPVGAFLSSGIDSTAVVALSREFNPNILTFTVGYDVPGFSEIDVARESARHLEVTTIPTTITAEDVMAALPKIVWYLDDPVADPSLVPLYFLARKAAEHVTVVLSGEGADEFFGGYAIYREPMSLSAVHNLPDPVQKGLRLVSRAIPSGVKGKSFLERGTTPIEARYYGNARIFAESEKRRLLRGYDDRIRYTDVTAGIYADCADLDDVTRMQYVDLHTWLRGDILVKADRMSMAHSLQARLPFLDKEVFAVASRIPVELKLPPRSDATKYALRRALAGVVPPAIVDRAKLGFPTPTRVWLREEMYEWARDVLDRSGAGDLLDLGYVARLLEEHRRGQADHARKVWTVLVFCLWHAIFVEHSLDPGIERNPSALLTKPVVGSMVA